MSSILFPTHPLLICPDHPYSSLFNLFSCYEQLKKWWCHFKFFSRDFGKGRLERNHGKGGVTICISKRFVMAHLGQDLVIKQLVKAFTKYGPIRNQIFQHWPHQNQDFLETSDVPMCMCVGTHSIMFGTCKAFSRVFSGLPIQMLPWGNLRPPSQGTHWLVGWLGEVSQICKKCV